MSLLDQDQHLQAQNSLLIPLNLAMEFRYPHPSRVLAQALLFFSVITANYKMQIIYTIISPPSKTLSYNSL